MKRRLRTPVDAGLLVCGLAAAVSAAFGAVPPGGVRHDETPQAGKDELPRLKLSTRLTRPPVLLALNERGAAAPEVDRHPGLSISLREPGVILASAGEEEQTPPGAGRTTPSAVRDEQAEASPRWGLAPIRWGGVASDQVRWTRRSGRPSSLQHIQMTDFRAATYIWQPWFANLSGSLGFVSGTLKSRGEGESGSHSGSRSTTITGGAALALFPVSRFPFSASFNVSDSRASSQLSASEHVSKRFSLRQSYRPERGPWSANGSFDASILEGTFGRDVVHAASASFSTRLYELHSLDVSGSFSRNRRSSDSDGSDLFQIHGRHTYRPEEELLSVESTVSAASTRLNLGSGSGPVASRSRHFQANVFANWRPDEDMPLDITGGGRFFYLQNTGASTADSYSLSGNVAAVYRWSANLSANASLLIAQVEAGGTSTLVSTQSAGLGYSSNAITFGNFSYGWNASAGLSNQIGGPDGGARSVSGQLSHRVNREAVLGENVRLSANASQGVSVQAGSASGNTTSLSHSAGLSLSVSRGDRLTGFANLTVSDSRSTGQTASEFQFVSLQLNGQMRLGRYSGLDGNMTFQFSRQAARGIARTTNLESGLDGTDTGWHMSAHGSASYRHARALGMPGLRYTLRYTVNTASANRRLLGDPDADREAVGHALDQELDYRIGRLDFKLSTQLASRDGTRDALVFFQVSREFGGF